MASSILHTSLLPTCHTPHRGNVPFSLHPSSICQTLLKCASIHLSHHLQQEMHSFFHRTGVHSSSFDSQASMLMVLSTGSVSWLNPYKAGMVACSLLQPMHNIALTGNCIPQIFCELSQKHNPISLKSFLLYICSL